RRHRTVRAVRGHRELRGDRFRRPQRRDHASPAESLGGFQGRADRQETTTFGVQQGCAPTTAQFDGPPTGVTIRSGMIRYTRKLASKLQLMASLETPKVDVAYSEFFAPDVRATDQRLPDLVANASKAGDWGYVSLSALIREIRFRTTTS